MQWVKPEVVRPQWVRVKGGGGVPSFTACGIGVMLVNGDIVDYNDPRLGVYTRDQIKGITIEDENISVIISPDAPQGAYFCGGRSVCPQAVREAGIDGAGGKYIGEAATATFRECLTADQSWAVNRAYNTMIDGRHCYLPYQGELLTVFRNKDIINDLRVRCGGAALPGGDYWSSALLARVDGEGVQTDNTDGFLSVMAGINFGGNKIWGLNVQGYYYVLPMVRLLG